MSEADRPDDAATPPGTLWWVWNGDWHATTSAFVANVAREKGLKVVAYWPEEMGRQGGGGPFRVEVDLVRARSYAASLCERQARSIGEDMANRTYAGHLVAMADRIEAADRERGRLERIAEAASDPDCVERLRHIREWSSETKDWVPTGPINRLLAALDAEGPRETS